MKIRRSTFVLAVALALFAWAFFGCSRSSFRHGTIKATNTRWLWQSQGFRASFPTTNGPVTVELDSSNTDTAAISALAEGIAKGAVKGAIGKP